MQRCHEVIILAAQVHAEEHSVNMEAQRSNTSIRPSKASLRAALSTTGSAADGMGVGVGMEEVEDEEGAEGPRDANRPATEGMNWVGSSAGEAPAHYKRYRAHGQGRGTHKHLKAQTEEST